jgi:hypothetical protein
LALPSLPAFPAREKSARKMKKYFQNSKKIIPKLKMQKNYNQAIAVYPNLVRTHFEALWKRNQRIALLYRLMLRAVDFSLFFYVVCFNISSKVFEFRNSCE